MSDRLERFISSELNKLKINHLIRAITTDNANDIKKATKSKFGKRISCFCHNLNLILKTVLRFSIK